MRKHTLLIVLVIVSLLGGCTLPGGAQISQGVGGGSVGGGSAAYTAIASPADGSQFPLGETITVVTVIDFSEGASMAVLAVNGVPYRQDELSTPLYKGRMLQGWLPDQAGVYMLQVTFFSASGVQLDSNTISVTIGESSAPPEAVTPEEVPVEATATLTPIPEEPTATPTPTLGPPMATADVDANCRFGPGTVYDVISYLKQGQSALIVGRDANNTWWVIQRLEGSGTCWVADSTVTVSGDLSNVPVVAAPPTPTPTPTATPQPLTAPVPLSPTGSMSCVSSVDLTWQGVSLTNSQSFYEWELYSADLYSGNYSFLQSGTTADTHSNVYLACAKDYQWRVRVLDSDGVPRSPYSDFLSFTIN